jgi:hypothetical protein
MAQLGPALKRALEKRRPKAALPLYEGSRTVLATLNREDLIPAALDLAEHTMRAQAAALALTLSVGTELLISLSPARGPLTKGAVQSLAQQAMQARLRLYDLSSVASHSQVDAAAACAGSVLTYPLEARNAMLGALVLWRDSGVAKFSAFDVDRGRLLADEIVIALDNARLYRDLSERLEAFAKGWKRLVKAPRTVAGAHTGKEPSKLTATVAAKRTPMWKYCEPALRALAARGGTASLAEMVENLSLDFAQTLTDFDRATSSSRGVPRWHKALKQAYRHCQREGWIEKRQNGIWKITSKGAALAVVKEDQNDAQH